MEAKNPEKGYENKQGDYIIPVNTYNIILFDFIDHNDLEKYILNAIRIFDKIRTDFNYKNMEMILNKILNIDNNYEMELIKLYNKEIIKNKKITKEYLEYNKKRNVYYNTYVSNPYAVGLTNILIDKMNKKYVNNFTKLVSMCADNSIIRDIVFNEIEKYENIDINNELLLYINEGNIQYTSLQDLKDKIDKAVNDIYVENNKNKIIESTKIYVSTAPANETIKGYEKLDMLKKQYSKK